ncbi:hypothetical protein TNCV_4971061 [Trichonephila clavipes]|nr:hypothetical protein TNCV_4971061 [Trichonephila clavipes]
MEPVVLPLLQGTPNTLFQQDNVNKQVARQVLNLLTGFELPSLARKISKSESQRALVLQYLVFTTGCGQRNAPEWTSGVKASLCKTPGMPGDSSSRHSSEPVSRIEVMGEMIWWKSEERWDAPDPPIRPFSLKIGVKMSLIGLSPVWCSKLRLTTCVT